MERIAKKLRDEFVILENEGNRITEYSLYTQNGQLIRCGWLDPALTVEEYIKGILQSVDFYGSEITVEDFDLKEADRITSAYQLLSEQLVTDVLECFDSAGKSLNQEGVALSIMMGFCTLPIQDLDEIKQTSKGDLALEERITDIVFRLKAIDRKATVFTCQSPYTGKILHQVLCVPGEYVSGGLCLSLSSIDYDDIFSEDGRITVSLNVPLDRTYSYVDVNNMPNAISLIKKHSLGKPTGQYRNSGYCNYPLYEFDMDAVRKNNSRL